MLCCSVDQNHQSGPHRFNAVVAKVTPRKKKQSFNLPSTNAKITKPSNSKVIP
jgi:hypothetical protein